MTPQERAINEASKFYRMPKTAGNDPYQRPCQEIGGVQIYAYYDDGFLVVSLHYDTADPEVQDGNNNVPTKVYGGGGEVVWSAP